MSTTEDAPRPTPLFVYGSMLRGERDHALLAGAVLAGARRTAPIYTLVDVGPYAALVGRGTVSITGELYLVDRKVRFTLDVARECPILFQRELVDLDDGTTAEAYVMKADQVRGKRRLPGGDYKKRFQPRPVAEHARAPAPFRSRSRP